MRHGSRVYPKLYTSNLSLLVHHMYWFLGFCIRMKSGLHFMFSSVLVMDRCVEFVVN